MKALVDQTRSGSELALPELMGEVSALLGKSRGAGRRPLASVHHFACTGGTLFAKALSAMPNVSLISELDPFTHRGFKKRRPRFAPTDIIGHLRYLRQDTPESVTIRAYEAALRSIYDDLTALGLQLLIRDHPHSHYCIGESPPTRTTHAAFLRNTFDARAAVTVRDPVESWQSLVKMDWVDFTPATFDEYCRRYHLFLDDHAGLPVFRYEDLVVQPEAVMRRLCKALGMDYNNDFMLLLGAVAATGDSGRKGVKIEPRAPKKPPETLRDEMARSEAYDQLCKRLGYSTI